MSLITGIPTECLFANTADGTQLTTFTSEASLMAGWGGMQPVLPAGFFVNIQQGTAKALRLRAMGLISTTGTPTFTFFVRFNTTQGVITGTSVGQSAAITTGSAITNQPFELELDIIMRTMGYGSGAATLQAAGLVSSPGFASPFMYLLTPAASATVWTTTIDASVTQFISLSAACGTSNASNKIQLLSLDVLGLN